MDKHYYVQKDGRIVSDYDNLCAAVKHAKSIDGMVLESVDLDKHDYEK